ncbi:hypothetical protein C0Q70_21394 [Pomacea canaliculata]|uniref:Uncharacterized protein n=1 Tax=Pomacea canaliculata TaxID=400727 RepID=A0A2T7NCE7_POMCA|nr:hypothetical protein C0Q70_21394 [Pomacea canaliculata]
MSASRGPGGSSDVDVHVDVADVVKKGKKTHNLSSCLTALSCFHKKTTSWEEDEEHHDMKPELLVGGHLHLRPPYQLTDNREEAKITRVGAESCGNGADDAPLPVTNRPRLVLLRKSKPFEKEFMVVSVTGFLTMKSISSLQDTAASFLKRDYILEDGQYAATFMNMKTLTYVAVNTESHVYLYLGYRGSVVEVTDDISSFNMLPASSDTPVADHHIVRVRRLKTTTSRVEPESSSEDFDMAGDHHIHETNGGNSCPPISPPRNTTRVLSTATCVVSHG